MKIFKKIAFVTFIIITSYVNSNSQSLELQIDSLLMNKYLPSEPGAVFLIAKDGKAIYRKAFGMANLELNVPMKSESVFQIGSMTKQFTAVSILMLMEEGKLRLDDDIRKYIPDYPTNGHKITIHNLLTHTSGIKDYTSMRSIYEIAKKDLASSELVDFFKDEPMDFNPGDKFDYNNSGYVILGYIIELVSRMTYEDFVEKNIFEKIGMVSSRYASYNDIVKNRASGYRNRNGFVNAMHISFSITYSAGSIMSTVDDMFKWQEAINNNLLVSQLTIEKAFTNYKLNNGENINYGYGWHIKDINGIPSREHGGSIFGFKSMGVYIPSEDIYVIGLTNCDCNSPTQITRKIAEIAINEL